MGNVLPLTLILTLTVAGACAGLAVPDPAQGDAGSSLPPPAGPAAATRSLDHDGAAGASPEGEQQADEEQDAEEVDARQPRTAPSRPVRGSGPMIECYGANCPDAGACGAEFEDLDCDEAWKECADGMHRDYVAGDSCSTCVPDAVQTRSCEWARTRYRDFLSELTQNSCADFCNSAADCSASLIENACMSDLVLPLYGMIDEEIVQAAESFSNENCAALCGSEAAPSAPQPGGSVACVNHRCTFAD